MEKIPQILGDTVVDTLKLMVFLFFTYLALEALEHKAGDRAEKAIQKAGGAGPAIGALLGVFPQCGFSAAATTFYAGRVITLGTLFAVYLSTSDEMLPIFIAEQTDIVVILKILLIKLVIGMVMGFLIDAIFRIVQRRRNSASESDGSQIHVLCEQDNCDCGNEEGGILRSAIKHTLQVTLYIFLISLALNAIITFVGENALASLLSANPALSVFVSALVGLIPNCGASIIITQLYLDGALSTGAMMAGLLVAAGVGLLVLFRSNRHLKENLAILAALYITGAAFGLAFSALNIVI